jgi:hypothetical protein
MLRRDADVLREMGDANPSAAERVERAVATLEEKSRSCSRSRPKRNRTTSSACSSCASRWKRSPATIS